MYMVGLGGCALLFRAGRIPETAFFVCTVHMQLVEAIMHYDGPRCSAVNRAVTVVGTLINHAEPLALYAGAVVSCPQRLTMFHGWVARAYGGAAAVYTTIAVAPLHCTMLSVRDGHLNWRWNEAPGHRAFYSIFLLTSVALSTVTHAPAYFAGVILMSYAASYWVYADTHSIGAMWCFVACLGPYVLLLPATLKRALSGRRVRRRYGHSLVR